ncbi:MAG TPA: NAD(P)H-dependent oxidoreductase [Microthrixaceae bacterium]|nr:NAD(P)H-dependent oxidoreductase [Microthrixaceae bacterium]
MSESIVVVVGNPQRASRTRSVAERVGAHLARIAGTDVSVDTIDLAELGPALLEWGSDQVRDAKASVLAARALVVASPTYKASFTGLVKLFLDQFGHGELDGLPTVALMTGGSYHHSLAVNLHLTPVLAEIGASLPAPGLYIAGDDIDAPDALIDAWMGEAGPPLTRALIR